MDKRFFVYVVGDKPIIELIRDNTALRINNPTKTTYRDIKVKVANQSIDIGTIGPFTFKEIELNSSIENLNISYVSEYGQALSAEIEEEKIIQDQNTSEELKNDEGVLQAPDYTLLAVGAGIAAIVLILLVFILTSHRETEIEREYRKLKKKEDKKATGKHEKPTETKNSSQT